MASTEDLGYGKFKIYVELGYNERGKRIRRTKTVTATSERNLKKQVREFEMACFNDKEVKLEDITFGDFAKRWMENHVEATLTLTTQDYYKYILYRTSLNDHFKKMKMKDIKKYHIVNYLADEVKNKGAVLPNKTLVLKSIFSRAIEWDVIDINPAIGVKAPERQKKEVNYYNEQELNHLFKVLDDVYPKHRIAIKLAAIGGLRRSEVLGITEEAINYEDNTILVDKQLRYNKHTHTFYVTLPKNKKTRTVHFPETFMQELKKYHTDFKARRLELGNLWRGIYDENGAMINLIIVKSDGYPTHVNSISTQWSRIINRFDLKNISFHQLRHSCASLMVKKGVNFKVIQERLGHANIAITLDLYSHIEDDQHKKSTDVFSDIL